MNEQRERRVLFLLLFFLLALGLLMCYSTSQAIANRLTGDSNYFFYRHIISIVIGLFCMLFFYKIPIDFLSRFYKVLIFICIFLLFLVFIPGLGKTVGGSTRWISLAGFTIQSSELTKFSLLLYFSTFFPSKKDEILLFREGILPPVILSSVIIFLIALEPDLSSSLIVLTLLFSALFLVGARFSHILFLFAIGLPFLIIFLESKRYVLNRFAILDPYSDPFGKGYHLIQSFKAFQKGGFFGVGPGNSTQKNLILPESHTDFIFSIMGEEVGFIGCLFFILLLFYFLYRGFRLASLQEDQRRYLFIALSFFLISFESILHIFVTLGLVPTTGLPLPFISYGKTFMVVHLSIMGLVLNNTKQKTNFSKQDRTIKPFFPR